MKRLIYAALPLVLAGCMLFTSAQTFTGLSGNYAASYRANGQMVAAAEIKDGQAELKTEDGNVKIFSLDENFQPKEAAKQIYLLRTAKDMQLLREHPDADFVLMNDVDMKGQDWSLSEFLGTLDGNGHTIRNLRAFSDGSSSNMGGICYRLGKADGYHDACVKNLTVADSVLVGHKKVEQIGAICGACYGIVENCKAENVTVTGANASGVDFQGETVGTFGWVHAQGAVICTLPAKKNDRSRVVDYMRQMATVRWRVTQDNSFACTRTLTNTTNPDKHDYRAGTVYTGLPYGNFFADLMTMQDNAAPGEDGVWTLDPAVYTCIGLETVPDPIEPSFGVYFCNDCSSALTRAWQQASASVRTSGTLNLVPSQKNMDKFRFCKVGDYFIDEDHYQYTVWNDNGDAVSVLSDEDGTILQERVENLYRCYAMAQPADGLIARTQKSGHARLIENVHTAYYDDGGINPYASYITCIEQCGGDINKPAGKGLNGKIEGTYTTWKNGSTYSFYELAGGGKWNTPDYQVYVPITCGEFAADTLPEAEITYKSAYGAGSVGAVRTRGVVSSNYPVRSSSLTVDGVTDRRMTGQFGYLVGLTKKSDTTRYDSNNTKAFPNYEGIDATGKTEIDTMKNYYTSLWASCRATYHSVSLERHNKAFAGLTKGVHPYEITVQLANGESLSFAGLYILK